MARKYTVFMLIAFVVAALDQLSKWWVIQNIQLWKGRIEVLPGFFDLVHYQNTGAAFGVGNDWGDAMTVFAIFTIIALSLMGWMVTKLDDDSLFEASMMGMITGGIIGNAIDRARMQAVTDFLRFYTENATVTGLLESMGVGATEWPSFNVADMGIVVGIIVFFVQQLFFQDRMRPEETLADEDLDIADLEEKPA